MIFNLVLDCIIKTWKLEHPEKAEIIQAIFYADNGLLQTEDAKALQEALDKFTEYFLQVDLNMNAAKTKAMVMVPGPIRIGLTSPAYRHRMTGEGGTAQERWALKVPCPHCQIEIQASSMQRPLVTMHQIYIVLRTIFQCHKAPSEQTARYLDAMVEPPAEMICVSISCEDIPTTPYASWRKDQIHYLNVVCA
jgi:hypothetical protein